MAFGISSIQNDIFKPEAKQRIENKGGLEHLQQQDSVDHAGTRMEINDWLRNHPEEVQRQKAAAQDAEVQRALNAVQSKMKVEERESQKAKGPHAYDSFQSSQDSQPEHKIVGAKEMAAFMNGFRGVA